MINRRHGCRVAIEPIDHVTAAVRAYAPPAKAGRPKQSRSAAGPSEWVLVIDARTTNDAAQRLRFGCFQFRRGAELDRSGLFYVPAALTARDRQILASFARKHGLELFRAEDFIETIFFKLAYQLRATIVGFDLPFIFQRCLAHGLQARPFVNLSDYTPRGVFDTMHRWWLGAKRFVSLDDVAWALGIDVSTSLLARADEVIE